MDDHLVSCRYSPQGCSKVNLIHQGCHNGERRGLSIPLGATKYSVIFLICPSLSQYQKVKQLVAYFHLKKVLVGCKLFSCWHRKRGRPIGKKHNVKGFVKHFKGHKLNTCRGFKTCLKTRWTAKTSMSSRSRPILTPPWGFRYLNIELHVQILHDIGKDFVHKCFRYV